jgi:hypothetical protein
MGNLYDILGTLTGKTSQEVKGSAKEVQLDMLTKLISTLTLSNAKTLRNIYVPYARNTKTTEIDMMLFANGNIYVFEVKNYTCAIVGSEEQKSWKTVYTKEKTYEMYNPIMQNNGHISTLASYLKLDSNLFKSVVVFSEKADISKVKFKKSDSLNVLTMDKVVGYLLKEKFSSKNFTQQQLNSIYEQLKPLTKVTKSVKEQHIKDVQSKK